MRGTTVRRPVTSLLTACVVAGLAVVRVEPVNALQQLDDAQTALRTGHYDGAIAQYTRILRRQPSSVDAAQGLVVALREIGRYDDARQAAERFGAANDNSAELANSLGEILYLQGDREGAEHAFRRASAAASDSLCARLNLAILLHDRGAAEEARREFDRFIDVYNRIEALSSRDLTLVATAVRRLGELSWELSHDALRAYDEAIAADPSNLEPRVLVGELFLERYQGTDAHAAFEDVLQVNPRHPRALLGMARTALFNGESNAMELVNASLGVNPNLVPARVFLATLHLQLEDYDRAADEVERALEVNPSSLEALAVQAATRFLSGDQAGFEQSRRRVLLLNPGYSDLYNTLAEASGRNRLYEQAARFARRAVELDSLSWRGYALLGINELRNGRMREGRQHLERAFAGDPFDVWTKNTLDLLDTLEQYPKSGTTHFEFFVDGAESELLTLYLSDIAEEAYEPLAERYGYNPPTPIRIEVFPEDVDFSVRTVGLVGLRALGVSFGPVVAMISPSAKEEGYFNWGSTLWHELAHTFHMGLSEFRVPRWFTEGLAVLDERRARAGWGDDVNPGFLAAHLQGRLHEVSELNNGFTRPEYPEQLGYSYYQASLVCELIERDHGIAAITSILRGYAAGRSSAELFQSVLNSGMEEFQRRFDSYMRERFATPLAALRVPQRGDSASPPSRRQLVERAQSDPSDFLAQLVVGQILFGEGNYDEALPYLERAKSLFPGYAGQESPHWFLAQLRKERGEPARAVAELRELIAIDERHYAARLELAELLSEQGDLDGAAAALEELLYIYPMHMDLHLQLAGLHAEAARWPAAIRERRAVLALDPVDRAEARYQLAKAYFDSGDVENARRAVLQALEEAPNFQRAQELLLEIHTRRGSVRD